jgi:hypothetical protein
LLEVIDFGVSWIESGLQCQNDSDVVWCGHRERSLPGPVQSDLIPSSLFSMFSEHGDDQGPQQFQCHADMMSAKQNFFGDFESPN